MEKLKQFKKPNLMTQVLIGAVLGIIVGRFVPQLGLEAEFLGSLFMNMIQMVIVPLIFPLIVLAIVEMSQAQRFGGLAVKSFVYFFGVTTALIVLTLVIGVVSGVGSSLLTDTISTEALEGIANSIDVRLY